MKYILLCWAMGSSGYQGSCAKLSCCRWYLLALTKGRVAIGDSIRVSKSRKEFRDFEHGPKVVASTGLAALYQWLSELLRRFAAIISLWIPSKAQDSKVE